MISKIKRVFSEKNDKEIIINILFSFIVKGGSMLLSLFTFPIYIRFFGEKAVLGVWYTILSVVNWVSYFDLGLGNGLRNKLPYCFINEDKKQAKEYIASTYVSVICIVVIWIVLGNTIISVVDWNGLLNIDKSLVSNETLKISVRIILIGILVQFLTKLIYPILYALQRSAVVNFLSLISTALTLGIIIILPAESTEINLKRISIINAVAINLPSLVATILLFCTRLKDYLPHLRDCSLRCAKEIINVGLKLLWLTAAFMVIANTNELLISSLTKSEYVVEFQGYNKIFNAISSLFTLALAPIWSAVTKAFAEGKYIWIRKLNNRLIAAGGFLFAINLLLVPFLQFLVDVWLGSGYIKVNYCYAVIFAVSNTLIYIHSVNTSIGNGISYFKIQIIFVTIAALIDIPLAYLAVNMTGSWIGIVLANIISLLPYEIIEIYAVNKHLANCG